MATKKKGKYLSIFVSLTFLLFKLVKNIVKVKIIILIINFPRDFSLN